VNSPSLSRRDFLKLSGLGLLGSVIPRGWLSPAADTTLQSPITHGRVTEAKVIVYDTPSFDGQRRKDYWRDEIVPISMATIGDKEPSYNRVWYYIMDEGYVHSGSLQPVRTVLNQPVNEIPATGALAEITVPYTDVRWEPGQDKEVSYRFYYETTHWISGLTYDETGEAWYIIVDDKWDENTYYALAKHVRLIPSTELVPLSPDVPPQIKRIEIRTEQQVVIAYEGSTPVFMARAATGARFSNGTYYTPAGRHMTYHKRPFRHMATDNLAANGFDLPGVPWISYITERGVAIHGTYWHNNFGHPRSHGCVNLPSQAARWIYLWTLPTVPADQQFVYWYSGTYVDVV
jgi:hypothetical protein